ncbi:unnamed protein product, partial [Ostreobium quekettii]
YTLSVPAGSAEALSRQVVKADSATILVPELEFEIPSHTQKGVLSTVEGMLRRALENLQALQEVRRRVDPINADKIDGFCSRLEKCSLGEEGFTLILDDPAGNSFIEFTGDSLETDPQLTAAKYERTKEQQEEIGLLTPDDEPGRERPTSPPSDPHHGPHARGTAQSPATIARLEGSYEDSFLNAYAAAPEEVLILPGQCLACGVAGETRMFPITIPYFKEVIVMSNACDSCGYKNSELRPGGGLTECGRKLVLKVEEVGDLNRDVIKSHSGDIEIPELEFAMGAGGLQSIITTVEGLVMSVIEEMKKLCVFQLGDSADEVVRAKFTHFLEELESCAKLERKWTLVIRDPLANSFIAPLCEDPSQDDRLTVEEVEQTEEERNYYGINHLKEQERLDALRAQGSASGAAQDATSCPPESGSGAAAQEQS